MYLACVVSLRDALEQPGNFAGWLFLPKSKPWALDTQGIFIKEDKDADPADPFPPAIFDGCDIVETLDVAGIEDVISNAEAQIEKPTLGELLKAFLFYVDNDAFIEF